MTRVLLTLGLAAALIIVIGLLIQTSRNRSNAPEQFLATPNEATENTASGVVRGKVTSRGKPISDATVRWKGTSVHTTSNALGNFILPPTDVAENATRITASKSGYFIGGTDTSLKTLIDSVTIELKRQPNDDSQEYAWVDPTPSEHETENCGNCHREIYDEWSSSGHARTRGRRFENLVNGTDWHNNPDVGWNLAKEHPHGVNVCDSCHAPSSELFEMDATDAASATSSSVHCDFCHKIKGVLMLSLIHI